jgi:hypothetical protein
VTRRARPLTEYPLVLVEWSDASRIFDGWLDLKEVPEPTPHKCVSVGFSRPVPGARRLALCSLLSMGSINA